MQLVIGVGAVIGALGIIWQKALRPLYRGANAMISQARVLDDVADQFRSDSGSSLKDAINRLEAAAEENQRHAAAIKANLAKAEIQLGIVKELAAQDRQVLQHLLILLDRLTVKGEEWTRSVQTIEAVSDGLGTHLESNRERDQARVAGRAGPDERRAMNQTEALARIEASAEVVAADLAASHERADAIEGGPGEAADAASRSPEEPITKENHD